MVLSSGGVFSSECPYPGSSPLEQLLLVLQLVAELLLVLLQLPQTLLQLQGQVGVHATAGVLDTGSRHASSNTAL
jgi:hypothetical protein